MFKKVFFATTSVLVVGITLSTVGFLWLRSIRLDELVSIFESDAQFASERIYRTLIQDVNTEDVANFITTVPDFNHTSFETFTKLAAGFGPGSKATVLWNPLVPATEKEEFEKKARSELGNFTIYQDQVSDPDADLWPTLYVYPENDNLLGLDINSSPDFQDAIEYITFFQDNGVSDRVFDPRNGDPSIQSLNPVFDESGTTIGCVTRLINVVKTAETQLGISHRDGIVSLESYNNLKMRIYLILGNGVERLMFVKGDGIEKTLFDSIDFRDLEIEDIPSSEYEQADGSEYSFVRYTSLQDDIVRLKFVIKARITVDSQESVIPFVLALISTLLIAFGIKKWRTLLSHRKKALDIAIHESDHKSKFVSEMSHEFRTPLNGILGMTELLKAEEQTKHGASYISIIDSCSTMLMGIVNDILDFSKLASGGMSIHPCPNNIRDLFTSTMLAMCATYKKKDDVGELLLRLNVDKSVPSGMCELDEVRVRQIIVNYISNAMKFTKAGAITVSVKCTNEDVGPDELRLVVDVADTGMGISQDMVGHLFKSFSQVHDPRVTKAGGTGLGLVICKSLSEKMGGGVSVESTQGKGTTFSFNCKIGGKFGDEDVVQNVEWDLSGDKSKNVVGDFAMERPSKPAVDEIGACFQKRSDNMTKPVILVVDDLKINRLMLLRMLEPLNVEVHTASDGQEAVKECERKKFSIVLMDMLMPIMGGAEAHRLVKETGNLNSETPIICTSGSEEKGSMDDSLLKPISKTNLFEKLAKWMSDSDVSWMHHHWQNQKEQ